MYARSSMPSPSAIAIRKALTPPATRSIRRRRKRAWKSDRKTSRRIETTAFGPGRQIRCKGRATPEWVALQGRRFGDRVRRLCCRPEAIGKPEGITVR